MKTIILGKDSYLSRNLTKKIQNSSVFSIADKKIDSIEFDNTNIIINSFYSSLRLEKVNDYEIFIKKSIYELSQFLNKIKKKRINIIIYTSSSAVYNSINESDFKDERNRKIYASTKYAAENLIKNFCFQNNIKLCIARIFNIFGENEKFSIISKVIDCYKSKSLKLNLINKGESIRDFIHISDVVKVYQKILKFKHEGIIDVGSGFGIKIKNILEVLGNKNFIIKNINKIEPGFSIAQNIKFEFDKRNLLEIFLKKKLKIHKKLKFNHIYSTKKNLFQDYIPGSIIYGAGKTGQKLLKIYRETKNDPISYFVDDDPRIVSKKKIEGIQILSFQDLVELSNNKTINNIIIAIPSLSLKNLNNIINKLSSITLNVSFINLNTFGEKKYLNLSDVSEKIMSEIFKRKTNNQLNFVNKIKNRKVLITGAGGSIGSELVKQCIICGAKVIALDHSELALYNLQKDLHNQFASKYLKTILGSIIDKRVLKQIKEAEKIDFIFHAAAYKHVNLLEKNVSLAIENNIFGTKNILDIFNNKNIEIVIISTDKAARPKSVLGATKRISEIVCQNYRKLSNFKSKIKIVRFGNVFGSKGSAIELFINQLNKGYPITITDYKAKRYFMSIQEACNLVINVIRLDDNEKIFILNMGKQVLLKDIIYKLAQIKNIEKKDIKIKKVGLQKGEKIFEELSLNKKIQKTNNKEIFLVKEPQYNRFLVKNFLEKLQKINFKKNDQSLRKLIFYFLKKEK